MKLRTGQFDLETAFLYPNLNEETYMRIPKGYVRYMLEVQNKTIEPSKHVLLLKKAIYGLVQLLENGERHSKRLWLVATIFQVNLILAFSFRRLMVMNHCHLS
jgi:hypothetical protein